MMTLVEFRSRNDVIASFPVAAVAADAALAAEAIECYLDIFNATGDGEWGEQWTPEQVHEKLFADAKIGDSVTFLTLMKSGGALAGLVLVHVDNARKIITPKELPPDLRSIEELQAVGDQLVWLAGPGAHVALFRELGIRKEFRAGMEPVRQLVREAIRESLASGGHYLAFWTSKHSRLYPIVAGFGAEAIYDFHDPRSQLFMGSDLARAYRRFSVRTAEIVRLVGERIVNLGPSRT